MARPYDKAMCIALVLLAACRRAASGVDYPESSALMRESECQRAGSISTVAGVLARIPGRNPRTRAEDGVPGLFAIPRCLHISGPDLFVADKCAIRRVNTVSWEVSTLAGSEKCGGTDGYGTSARLNYPRDMASIGNTLYFVDDRNHVIRAVDTFSGRVSTVAGKLRTHKHSHEHHGRVDGRGSLARFHNPHGIVASAATGLLYVADYSNHAIRTVHVASGHVGEVATLAGSLGQGGAADGPGASARFYGPISCAISGSTLYVADYQNHAVRAVDVSTGFVTTVAGILGQEGHQDGPAGLATLTFPRGLAIDASGKRLFISDADNSIIRMADAVTGEVQTIAGVSGSPDAVDGGPGIAHLGWPRGLALLNRTVLLVADRDNHAIRAVALPPAEGALIVSPSCPINLPVARLSNHMPLAGDPLSLSLHSNKRHKWSSMFQCAFSVNS